MMTKSYYSRPFRAAIFAFPVAVGLLLLTLTTKTLIEVDAPSTRYWILIPIGAMTLFWIRTGFSALTAGPSGVQIRNPCRPVHRLNWDEIDRFSVDREDVFAPVARVGLKDGRSIRAWGVQSSGFFFGAKDERVEGPVAELNAELARRRQETSVAGVGSEY